MLALLWRLPTWMHTLAYKLTGKMLVMMVQVDERGERQWAYPPGYVITTRKPGTDRPLL